MLCVAVHAVRALHAVHAVQVSSYEQHLSDAQAASFQALQDQLHSFQNEMAAASHLRTQLVDRERQIDTIRHDAHCTSSACFILPVASQLLALQDHMTLWLTVQIMNICPNVSGS